MKNGYNIVFGLMLAVFAMFISSCIKNNDFIKGDAKVKFYNTVQGGVSQDFYLGPDRYGSAVSYGNNTPYVIVPGDSAIKYKVIAKNTASPTAGPNASLDYSFNIGKNYSVFYTKSPANDSLLYIKQDDVAQDTGKVKIFIINLGYTLKSKIQIRDSLNYIVPSSLSFKENSGYLKLNPKGLRIYIKLADSTREDSVVGKNLTKGKVYTVLIDGSKIGKLQTRLITEN